VNLGFAAGPATAGFLANRSFTWVFIGDAVTSLAYGVIALLFLPHGLRTYRKDERFGEAVRIAAADRRFMTFLAATACITVVDMQMGSTFALHVKSEGYSAATYGALVSLNGLLIILLELWMTARLQSRKPQPVIAIGFLLSGIGFFLTQFAHSIPMIAMTVAVWTLGEIVSSPMAVALVTDIAPERYRGRYMGLWVMTWSFGMIAGPMLGTFVFERNPSLLWWACAVLGIVSAVLVMNVAASPGSQHES
jgi:MFS family permease